MKKVIPVLVAVVLIIIIGAAAFGARLIDKYSYSEEYADLNEYFGITGEDDVPIILQDEMIEKHAKIWDNECYFDISTVHAYFNDRFYEDKEEKLLLYALPDAVVSTNIGSSDYKVGEEELDNVGYVISRYDGDMLYIAVDFVAKYTNFSYELFTEPYHMQVYTEWNKRQTAKIDKDTRIRYQGGIKSDILKDVSKGDSVIVLEEMEKWSKVKTADAYIGYVENKRLKDKKEEEPEPVKNYEEPEYKNIVRDHKINLAWHAIYSIEGNNKLEEVMADTKGVNVISPTWFVLTGDSGEFTSLASGDYVGRAHEMGLEVWALISNITDTEKIDMYKLLSRTSTRNALIDNLMGTVKEYGLDGLNIDFEDIGESTGEAFIEFIRELSIPCRAEGIVLSVDNYVPMGYNDHYRRDEQGIVADYVIIMGYDEHHGNSKEAGSVASIGFVENGISNTVAEVPADKVINALPFYTRIWETTGTTVSSQVVGMEMADEYVANHSIDINWDEETCQNYGEYQADNSKYQVWLEDDESIRVKLNIMDKYKIAGVAEWRLGLEKPSVWTEIEEYMNK